MTVTPESLMQELLGLLQGLSLLTWTAHWQSMGMSSYGDHLLLERLYKETASEVDACAEKLVGISQSGFPVSPLTIHAMAYDWLAEWCGDHMPVDPNVPDETRHIIDPSVVLLAEQHLQSCVKQVYQALKPTPVMTLGLDDFLMSVANTHDTHVYLLQQRVGVPPARVTGWTAPIRLQPDYGSLSGMASRVATAWRENPDGPSNPDTVFFDSPRKREVREFAQSHAVSNMGDVAKQSVKDSDNTDVTVRQEAAKVNKSPPTPIEIKSETPGSDEFSTLSRYVVLTEQPTDSAVPQGHDEIEKHPQRVAHSSSLSRIW